MAEPQNPVQDDQPLLVADHLGKNYGRLTACRDVSFALYPGEVLAIVGESGSGKSTLLQLLSAQLAPSAGQVSYRMRDGVLRDLAALGEAERRFLFRTDWGFVHQDPAQGLRMAVSAGANVGERLMAVGWNHYGRIRDTASSWLERVEIDADRIDDAPRTYSGGMRQRLQIARNLVTEPRLVFMDEPTGGLDVSVQARLLDLMRNLVSELGLAAIVVTHDLAVARLLSHRVMVMKGGRVIETGLTDQVLDDPARALHPAARFLDSAGMSAPMTAMIDITNAEKTFTMHLQGGVELPVVRGVSFHVEPGECVVLSGPSGAGKSSILKMIFGNYRCDGGRIGIRHQGTVIDLATAEPRQVLSVRRSTIGYVSQFLRAVPRVADHRRRRRAADRERDGARRGARAGGRAAAPPQHSRAAVGAAAVDLLRRRAAARQHRARLHLRSADPAAGRADRLARCRQPRRRGRTDRRRRSARASRWSAIVHDDEIRHLIADRIVDVTSFAAAA